MSNEDNFPLIRELQERTGQKPSTPPKASAPAAPKPAPPTQPKAPKRTKRPPKGTRSVPHYLDWTRREKAKRETKDVEHDYTLNSRVRHNTFGFGTVVEVQSNGLVSVQFDENDEKRRLMASKAPMRIVT